MYVFLRSNTKNAENLEHKVIIIFILNSLLFYYTVKELTMKILIPEATYAHNYFRG